jgi:fido (protein-threonine AMPylation protein)
VGHTWRPIEPLPAGVETLTDGELAPVAQVWADIRQALEGTERLAQIKRRFNREWAIETGQIEGVYNLDRGVTETLIERGIVSFIIPSNAGGERTASIISDHLEVLEGLFAFVKSERSLTVGYIKELHAALLRNQDGYEVTDSLGRVARHELRKGEFKSHGNSVSKPDGTVHQYCPPEQVASEMDRLIDLYKEFEQAGFPPEVRAAWLHHAFTQIHPFADGNGRVARVLATLVLIRAHLFPLLVGRDQRTEYLDCLEAADGGDLGPFVEFIVRREVEQVIAASQPGENRGPEPKIRPATVQEEIEAAKRVLVYGGEAGLYEHEKAIPIARALGEIAAARIDRLLQDLTEKIALLGASQFDRWASVETPVLGVEVVNGGFRRAAGIRFRSRGREALLHLSIFGLGPVFQGFAGAEMVFRRHGSRPLPPSGLTEPSPAGLRPPGHIAPSADELTVVSPHLFQTNYRESEAQASARFEPWLEESLKRGLAEWRRSL